MSIETQAITDESVSPYLRLGLRPMGVALREKAVKAPHELAALLRAQAWEVEQFGFRGAYLRSRVLGWWRRIENEPLAVTARRPYGIVQRIHKALEPKPLFATKHSIAWSRYVAGERSVRSLTGRV